MANARVQWTNWDDDTTHDLLGFYKGIPVGIHLNGIEGTWFIKYNGRNIKRGFHGLQKALSWIEEYLISMDAMSKIA